MNTFLQFLCGWIVFCSLFASADLKKSRNQVDKLRVSRSQKSQWSEPNECSRTCGGGVAYRERICSKSRNGNRNECPDEPERKYFLCNTQDCPQGSEDFRDAQCQQFDNQSFDGKLYKWVSYHGAEDQCSLHCLAKGEKFYRRLADKVVDGTPCDRNTLDVCIDGTCRTVGCDRVLGSKKTLDACLICGGYGATCRTEHGTIDTGHMESGYNTLIVLPEGATSITLQEEGTSKNYFAVRNENGVYYLNGNVHVGPAEPLYLGQTFFEYRRPHYGMEYLSALGPLREPLVVELLKQPGVSPSVRYDYSIPSNVSSGEAHTWIAHAWSPCNASCGFGYQSRLVSCMSLKTKREVDDENCSRLEKPSAEEECHRSKCTADWYIGEWQSCSQSCDQGTQVRKVFCQRTHEGGNKEVVSADQCQQPKPAALQECNGDVPCAEWEAGKWTKCAGVCGTGEQTRSVVCKEHLADHDQMKAVLPDSECDPYPRPSDHRDCDLRPCQSAEWMVSEWLGCSGSCDDTVETRQLKCSTKDGQLYPLTNCDQAKRPETLRPCPVNDACNRHLQKLQWFTSQWAPCSKTCGTGVQLRKVFCGTTQSGQVVKVPSSWCDPKLKLTEERECAGAQCSGAWFTGPFGKCSAACGGGERTRELFCFIGNESVDLKRCNENTRPDASEDCNQMACDDDNFLPSGASNCRLSEYGCCPDQFTAAEGPNYLGCASDPIPPGLCIDTEFGCCPDGLTPADGPFQHGCLAYSCKETRYGCCGDGETPAAGPDGEGCEKDEDDLPSGCRQSTFGCCPDGVTTRTGLNGEGCFTKTQSLDFESSGSGEMPECQLSAYGCCPDGVTIARLPDGTGCPEKTEKVRILDAGLPAIITPASLKPTSLKPTSTKQHFTVSRTRSTKEHTVTSIPTDSPTTTKSSMKLPTHAVRTIHTPAVVTARLPTTTTTTYLHTTTESSAKLPTHAVRSLHTPAVATSRLPTTATTTYLHTTTTQTSTEYPTPVPTSVRVYTSAPNKTVTTFDSTTSRHAVRHGHPSGLNCLSSVHGCCLDGKTPAAGPNFRGCPWDEDRYLNTCEDTPYGCCPDGVTAASGPNNAHCPHLLQRAVTCTLPRDPGPCRDRSVKWFYDAANGNCAQFEYGGCGGNANRFETSDACRQACISPEGIDRCYLPQSSGRCHRALIRFSYNSQERRCEEFVYGGCLGNENRFSTARDCEKSCIEPQKAGICNQPPQTGPCRNYQPGYYFDPKSESCQQFIYGGCRGNDNRFNSLEECERRCGESVVQNCRLPLDPGPCQATFYQWFFNSESSQCEEFQYGGCLGNANRFRSKLECEKSCKKLIRTTVIDRCSLSRDTGPCRAHHERWFYDQSDGYCKQFVYGGCAGNKNRFDSEPACREACDANLPIDVCTLHADAGPCRASFERYYFDGESNQCHRFIYGGCQGNGNNFQSIDECQSKCSEHIALTLPPGTNRCLLPRDPGPCTAFMIRWHYSPIDRRCVKFEYGGCGGNRNRFFAEGICNHECGHLSVTQKRTYVWPTQAPVVRHHEPSHPEHHNRVVMPTTPSVTHGRADEWAEADKPSQVPTESLKDEVVIVFAADDDKETEEDEEPGSPVDEVPTAPDNDIWNTPVDELEILPSTPYYHAPVVPDRPESWEEALPTDGGFARHETIARHHHESEDSHHKQEQKEEAPVYGHEEDFEDSEDSSSGALTNASPIMLTESLLISHVSPTPSKVKLLHTCSLHENPGTCKNYTYRWFYDQERGECMQFKFSGCEENENNFNSQEDCRRACPIEEICQLPSEAGPCFASKRRYFFDTASSMCQLFTYGGCKGNANRFLTLENCQRVCGTLWPAVTRVESEAVITTTPARTEIESDGDICSLPADPSPCRAYIPSYYFDRATSSCLEFIWGGCAGNANRFSTKNECEQKCLRAARHFEVTLPPEVAEPMFSTPSHLPSAPAGPTSPVETSGQRRWVASDVCRMHKDAGPCEDYRVVWYFEPVGRHCRRFYYGGCGGNDNKFNSSEQCHSRCLWSGYGTAADDSHHHTYEAVIPQTTLALDAQVTPAVSAHVTPTSSSTHTTQALPMTTTRPSHHDEVAEGESVVGTCDLPVDAGSYCNSGWQAYWYYDSDHSRCRSFYYGGCDGNDNRFATEEECAATCTAPAQPTTTDPCHLGPLRGPCQAYVQRWFYSAEEDQCRDFLYGGCGGNEYSFETRESCEQTCRTHADFAFIVNICLEPKETGPCTLNEVRWYFDQTEGKCEKFTYGGCRGNLNNFETERDCKFTCAAHLKEVEEEEGKDVCHLPKEGGSCLADYLRYYFSPEDNECRPFIYSGCQGNGNNFATQEECYGSCGSNDTSKMAHRMHGPGDCYLSAAAGPCDSLTARWYYDVTNGDCQAFYYGGCHGNGNNFLDYYDCLAFCSKVSESCGVLQCDLKCPYGFMHGADSCPICQCLDPCQTVRCPENTRCHVQNATCEVMPCTSELKTVCKSIHSKPGACPSSGEIDENTINCKVACSSDDDCDGEAKCCSQGCNQLCLLPQQPVLVENTVLDKNLVTTPMRETLQEVDEPEEAPVIESYPEVITVIQHSDLLLSCSARGAPRPQVTWFRDNFPILDGVSQKRDATILTNGSLFLPNVVTNDADTTYSCRVYNNIGADTHTYKLIVQVPTEIENESEMETISIVRGSTIRLSCVATGIPLPSIKWLQDGEPVSSNGKDNHKLSETELQISNVDSTDAGQYICRAKNGIGAAREKRFEISVIELLSAEIIAEKTNITAGDNLQLQCQVKDENTKGVNVTWSFNGRPLTQSETRYKVKALELVVESTKTSDGGEYGCTVTRGHDQATSSVIINVHGRKVPDKCVDKPWYANCDLIVEADLCRHAYFSIFCCNTCHKAGQLP